MSPKITVIRYKSKVLSNGEHPLILRVTQKGQRKYGALGISSKGGGQDQPLYLLVEV